MIKLKPYEDLGPFYKRIMRSIGKYRLLVLLGIAVVCLVAYACTMETTGPDNRTAMGVSGLEYLLPISIEGPVTAYDDQGNVLPAIINDYYQNIEFVIDVPMPNPNETPTSTIGVQLDGSYDFTITVNVVPGYEGETP